MKSAYLSPFKPKLLEDYTPNNLKIYTFNAGYKKYKDDPKKTLKWLNELGNPYSTIVSDPDGIIGINWGVYGIPETFIVNSEGIIKFRLVGPITKKNYNYFISKIKESKK